MEGVTMGSAFLSVAAIVMSSLCVGIPILVVLNAWLVHQSLGSGEATVLLMTLVGVLALVIKFWGHPVSYILLVLVLLACGLSPVLSSRLDRRALVEMDNEDIRKYKLALEHDPRNAAARSFLARVYLKQKRYDEAIEQFQLALEAYPDSIEDQRLLKKAVRERQQAEAEGVVCPACGAINPPGAHTCGGCEAALRPPGFLQFVTQPQNLKHIAITSALTLGVITLLGITMSFLPSLVCNFLMLLAFVGAIVYLWSRL